MDFFAARGLAANESSAGRFLDVDAAVDSETDCNVIRDEGVSVGVVRESGCFARCRNLSGEGAWFPIGSIPVPRVSHGHA